MFCANCKRNSVSDITSTDTAFDSISPKCYMVRMQNTSLHLLWFPFEINSISFHLTQNATHILKQLWFIPHWRFSIDNSILTYMHNTRVSDFPIFQKKNPIYSIFTIRNNIWLCYYVIIIFRRSTGILLTHVNEIQMKKICQQILLAFRQQISRKYIFSHHCVHINRMVYLARKVLYLYVLNQVYSHVLLNRMCIGWVPESDLFWNNLFHKTMEYVGYVF